VSATSPDGRRVAFVRNHADIDPPNQSIWVSELGSGARRIAQLGPDSDWCNTIVWSPDSTTVAFLIQDARLITVDAASRQMVSDKWLTPWEGEYPPYQMAVDLTLDARGTEARFRVCDRKMFRSGDVFDSTNCGDFRRVTLRAGS
jgi:Tol biopolymer transport system component